MKKEELIDYDYMKTVRDYYLKTGEPEADGTIKHSIKATAVKFGISRGKCKKILITLGVDIDSPLPQEVYDRIKAGEQPKALAVEFHISPATLNSYIPYQKVMYKGKVRTPGAVAVEVYRNSVKKAQESMPKGEKDRFMVFEGPFPPEESESTRHVQSGKSDADVNSKPEAVEEDHKCKNKRKNRKPNAAERAILDEMRAENEENVDFEPIRYSQLLSNGIGERLVKKGLLEEWQVEMARFLGFVRLHFEIIDNSSVYDEYDGNPLNSLGNVKYGRTMSRDVIVPNTMDLHSLHYMIQKLFGWRNSHLHYFKLTDRDTGRIVKNEAEWERLIGLVFPSPFFDPRIRDWDNDYEDGSPNTWLRSKYTPPWRAIRENSYAIQRKNFEKNIEEFRGEYVVEWYLSTGYDENDNKIPAPMITFDEARKRSDFSVLGCRLKEEGEQARKPWKLDEDTIHEDVCRFENLPWQAVKCLILNGIDGEYECVDETDMDEDDKRLLPFQILERLTIGEVLRFGNHCPDSEKYADYNSLSPIDRTKTHEDDWIADDCDEIEGIVYGVNSKEYYSRATDPDDQPGLPKLATELLYAYDYNDQWLVRITGSQDCTDLFETGRITQEEYDKTLAKAIDKRMPVCIAADGYNVLEDVGGILGYKEFLRTIFSDDPNRVNGMTEHTKEEELRWAREMGWNTRNVKPINIL